MTSSPARSGKTASSRRTLTCPVKAGAAGVHDLLGGRRRLVDADAASETNTEVIARIAREREPVELTMDDILAARDQGRR